MRRPKFSVFFTVQNAIALALLVLCLVLGWRFLSENSLHPAAVLQSIHELGYVGKWLFAGMLVLAVVISPIPGMPLTVAAGAVWDPLTAGVYASIGIFVGSLLAYFLGRTLGRSLVQAVFGKTMHLSRHRGEAFIGWLLFFSHLLPVIPFDLMSYGAGMIRLSVPLYTMATLLGTIPGTLMLAYWGDRLVSHPEVGVAIALGVGSVLGAIGWAIKRHNWLGIREVIQIK
jgi:uncharacterized membrane protein YdjX (TVP38/TMEM64 family)